MTIHVTLLRTGHCMESSITWPRNIFCGTFFSAGVDWGTVTEKLEETPSPTRQRWCCILSIPSLARRNEKLVHRLLTGCRKANTSYSTAVKRGRGCAQVQPPSCYLPGGCSLHLSFSALGTLPSKCLLLDPTSHRGSSDRKGQARCTELEEFRKSKWSLPFRICWPSKN